MRKNWFYMLMLMAMSVMPLTSCENNDDSKPKQHDPESDADQTEIVGFDGLEWLQSSIVVLDDNNEVLRRVYGKPLDESQPTVISVPVKNLTTAEQIFKSWIAPKKELIQVDGGYDYYLTDAEGNAQGSVAFRAVESEPGVIARMTVGNGTALKQISEVKFINSDLWPENDAIEIYEAGRIYHIESLRLAWSFSAPNNDYYGAVSSTILPFYCIQGNTNGQEAILVWLSPDENIDESHPTPSGYINRNLYHHLPPVSHAEKVMEFYNANYALWEKMLNEMEALGYEWKAKSGGETTGNSEFLLNEYNEDKGKIKCLDLDKKKGEINDVYDWSWFKYRYMYIRIFPAAIN